MASLPDPGADTPVAASPTTPPDVPTQQPKRQHAPPPAEVIDLMGVLAYGELSAFDRLAEDAKAAPDVQAHAALASMAAAEIGHYAKLEEFLSLRGVSVAEAMRPFVAAIDAFHASTSPRSWLESLVKAYVGDGLATDFYREAAGWVDPEPGELVLAVLGDTGHSAFAERQVLAAGEADRAVRDRLALWGRRLFGEALMQAQHVTAERESLSELIVRGSGDLSGVASLFKRLQDNHSARMRRLGLG